MNHFDHKINKKYIFIELVICIILGLIILLLFLLLPKSSGNQGKNIYDSLLTAVNKEVEKEFSTSITKSQINNVVFNSDNKKLYVNYTYNDDNIDPLLVFDYQNSEGINSILTYVVSHNELPAYQGYFAYTLSYEINNIEYKEIINNYYSKQFNKIYTSINYAETLVYASGLIKNNDESITSVDHFVIDNASKTMSEPGIMTTINKSNDNYYFLLDYLVNRA